MSGVLVGDLDVEYCLSDTSIAQACLAKPLLNIKEAIFCRSCPSIIPSGAFGQTKHPINF